MKSSQQFVYEAHAARVVFGVGTSNQVAAEVERLGARRALVLCTPNQQADARRIADLLGPLSAGVYPGAGMHVSVESAREAGADCAVAVGGGSTTGLGKAIALETGMPIVAIPTTYAGSEVTPVYGLTEAGAKRTGAIRAFCRALSSTTRR